MYSPSSTEAGNTPVAPPPDPRDVHGAASLQATTKINYGVTVEDKEVHGPFVTFLKSLVLAERPLEDGISTKQLGDARCLLMAAVEEMATTLEARMNVNRNV